MRALLTDPADPAGFSWGSVPEPEPGRDDVVVDVSAVSINRGDLFHAANAPAGTVRGYDFTGVVRQAAASGSGPAAGSEVAGIAGGGSWAQCVVAPSWRVATIPAELTHASAAALPVVGLTALYGLQRAGRLLGRRVVVTGAAGGVGGLVVQLAALGGARVTALVGAIERVAGLAELGAESATTYDADDLPPADIVIDTAGGHAFSTAMSLLRPGGMGVSLGNAARTEFVLPADFGQARAAFSHTWISALDEMDRQVDPASDLDYLLTLAAQRRIDPRVDLVAGWDQAITVLGRFRRREITGKAVLTLD